MSSTDDLVYYSKDEVLRACEYVIHGRTEIAKAIIEKKRLTVDQMNSLMFLLHAVATILTGKDDLSPKL